METGLCERQAVVRDVDMGTVLDLLCLCLTLSVDFLVGGYVVFGRSDATLNPGGVRIGTAEIYRQVEQLSWILESIAVILPAVCSHKHITCVPLASRSGSLCQMETQESFCLSLCSQEQAL